MMFLLGVRCKLSDVRCRQQGFIAVMSAIVISVLLIAITVVLGLSGFFGRINILDSESKERSIAMAEACADATILNLAQELPPPSGITVGTDTCSVVLVETDTPATDQTTIHTQANINKSYTNLEVVINDDDFSIISWQEVANH